MPAITRPPSPPPPPPQTGDDDGETCRDGLSPLTNASGARIDCSNADCPRGYRCSVGATRAVCCRDDEIKKPAGVEASDLWSGEAPALCSLPKERGSCDRYELRFYHHNELKEVSIFGC